MSGEGFVHAKGTWYMEKADPKKEKKTKVEE
jgi:hypothetical protein